MLCCIRSNLVATVDWPLGMCIYCLLDNLHCWWNPPLLDDSKSWAIHFKDTQFITITYPRNWMAFYRRYVQVDWYSTIEHIAIWSNLPRNGWNMLKWNQNRKHQKTILTYIKPNIKPYKTVLNILNHIKPIDSHWSKRWFPVEISTGGTTWHLMTKSWCSAKRLTSACRVEIWHRKSEILWMILWWEWPSRNSA